MGRRQRVLPPEVGSLSGRISEWRASKVSRVERMPAELWCEAVEVAEKVGVSAASQALGLSYAGLRRRVGETRTPSTGTEIQGGDFVALGNWAGWGPLVVEVQLANGARMRLEDGHGSSQAASLLKTFLENA